MRSRPVVVLLVAALASGCGSTAPRQVGAPATTPAVAPSPAVTPPARVTLTLADDGRTIRVSTVTVVTLVLGDRYRWRLPQATGSVAVSENLSDAPTGAQSFELRPGAAGRAEITTTGSPACRQTTPGCPAAERAFRVVLDVTS